MIPVCRPRLPDADALLPYLRRIDDAAWYSNFGPLVRALEARLAERFGTGEGTVATVSNGTAGLTLALAAQLPNGGEGGLCMMPSWTFAATPAAAMAAGLTPWFVDIDAESWMLTPALAEKMLAEAPGRVAAVVPVAPFGAPVDATDWDAFCERTGIPVVIDAAAAFDAPPLGRTPAMISLHATKALGVGEGGLVVSRDRDLIARIRSLSNFGFGGDRVAVAPGINAKLSEYAAAVGHAALDAWPAQRAAYGEVKAVYLDGLSEIDGIRLQRDENADWVGFSFNVAVESIDADTVIARLARDGIEARRWWQKPCHTHPAFARFATAALPVTRHLATHTVGLPFHPNLTSRDIERVCGALSAIVAGR